MEYLVPNDINVYTFQNALYR